MKRRLSIFICTSILVDSIYRKDENYYSEVFLEKYCFIEDIQIYCSNSDEEYYDEKCINLFLKTHKKPEIFWPWDFKFSHVEARKFHFSKKKKFFQSIFFYLFELGSSFLKFKKLFRVSISWNIRKFCFLKDKKFFGVSVSWNIRKGFFWENIRARKFHFPKYRKKYELFLEGIFIFFYFLKLFEVS